MPYANLLVSNCKVQKLKSTWVSKFENNSVFKADILRKKQKTKNKFNCMPLICDISSLKLTIQWAAFFFNPQTINLLGECLKQKTLTP